MKVEPTLMKSGSGFGANSFFQPIQPFADAGAFEFDNINPEDPMATNEFADGNGRETRPAFGTYLKKNDSVKSGKFGALSTTYNYKQPSF